MRFAYRREDNQLVWRERAFSDGPPPEEIVCEDGKVAKRSFVAERVAVPAAKGWPLECLASGVNAADAQALRDEFKRVGVPTEVSRDGNPIYTDAAHRRRALKARGLVDRSSYC